LIIFTSNIGADKANPKLDIASHQAHFRQMVSEYFKNSSENGGLGRPELLTRLGENNVVVFNFITDPDIRRKLVRTKLAGLKENLRERFGLQFNVSDACVDWLDTQNRQGCGGRDLINIIERDLINPMSNFLFDREHQLRAGRQLFVDVPAGQNNIKFEIKEANNCDKAKV